MCQKIEFDRQNMLKTHLSVGSHNHEPSNLINYILGVSEKPRIQLTSQVLACPGRGFAGRDRRAYSSTDKTMYKIQGQNLQTCCAFPEGMRLQSVSLRALGINPMCGIGSLICLLHEFLTSWPQPISLIGLDSMDEQQE